MSAGYGDVVTFDDGSGPALYASNIPWSGPCGLTVGRWNGQRWTVLDQGLLPSGSGFYLSVLDDGFGPRLYTGGNQCTSSYSSWTRRWNGQTWELPLPGFFVLPPDTEAYSAAPAISFDDGTGVVTYGTECLPNTGCLGNGVVRWTGSSWTSLGYANLPSFISGLYAVDVGMGARLYAIGGFSHIGGVAASGIAMWNGTSWEPVGPPLDAGPSALCQYDDGRGPALYACGAFSSVGGLPTRCIARWDGQSWSEVGGGVTAPAYAFISGLTVFDDGRGPALYAVGQFSQIGGVIANNIARWDGRAWQAVGAGIGAPPNSFAVFDDGRGPSLFMAGQINYAGAPVTGLVQWVGCPNCYANCDNSTQSPRLNILDFTCFLNRFAARDPYANCNVDAAIDLSDFLCFLNKFAAGCP